MARYKPPNLIFTRRKLKSRHIARHFGKTGKVFVYLTQIPKYALHPSLNKLRLDTPEAITRFLIRIINTEIICLMAKFHDFKCSQTDYGFCEPEILFRAYVEIMLGDGYNGTL